MEKTELYNLLDYVDHSREKRQEMANMALNNPALMLPLLQIAYDVDSTISSKACWVLEYAARKKLVYLFPHLDLFTSALGTVHLEPSIRPFAKICELLMISYYAKEENPAKKRLTQIHLEKIAEACFDWLIGDHKVAPKAYSMTSLLLLGRTFEWIHPELKTIVEQNYAAGSGAYKARARMILSKIK